jgi:hypothetical protein
MMTVGIYTLFMPIINPVLAAAIRVIDLFYLSTDEHALNAQ